ncbi:diguanylate cyclase [Intestinibacillus massiliensis]|uniref:diguanylate cyclase n=1 Tax=Intestinibacillus massiliensis TaxID=1871029 RepID=UPI000B3512B0|nr:diguanylate cyclase [Intestinibacillus massiliensis]
MRSIQTKFIALILSCVLLSAGVIGGAGILNAQRVVDGDSARVMNLLCEGKALELDALLSRIEQSVKTLSVYTLDELESMDRLKTDPGYVGRYTQKLESVAVNAANNTEGALAVYVRFNPEFTPPTSGLLWSKTERSGSFQQLTPTDLSSFSPSDTEHVGWYYIPVKNGQAMWMEPYYNQNLNVQMISYVIPLYRQGETVGVVGMDINFDVIERMLEGIRIYDSGYAFLADNQGVIMYHQDLAMGTAMGSVDKSLRPLVEELGNGTSGSTLYSYEGSGVKKELAFRTLRNGMHLAVTAPVNEINSGRNRLILQNCVALLLICCLSVGLTAVFTRRLVRPLKELNTAAKKIAEGDLSVTISTQTKDEVGTLADSFQKTVEHLQQYISYINGLAYRDAMTGVKNKTAYQEAERLMEDRMRTGRPEFAVVVLDINGLKYINDTYGHDFGDMLIVDACRLICKTFKHSPVYRIGGDEFAVILENDDLKSYPVLLEDFEKGMAEHNQTARPDSHLSIARGIAVYNSQSDLVFANVFKRADDAMYQNKAAIKAREKHRSETP